MPLQSNTFKCVLPLQHMAKVKTVEMLWGSSSCRPHLKIPHRFKEWKDLLLNKMPMIEFLLESIDRLQFPKVLEKDLKVYVIYMVNDAVEWLKVMTGDQYGCLYSNYNYDYKCAEMCWRFYDELSWDNNGFVDGRKILKSYVANKDTIPDCAWQMLYDYCIEEDIIRLSRAMDSLKVNKSKEFMFFTYWHWRIHGKFPTKEEYPYNAYEDPYNAHKELRNANSIVGELLMRSVNYSNAPGCVPAIKYFRSQDGRDKGEFQKLFNFYNFDRAFSPATRFYYAQQMDHKTWIEETKTMCQYLLQWPWALFIDDWMKVVEGMDLPNLVDIFDEISSIVRWSKEKMQGVDKEHRDMFHEGYTYPLFKQLWSHFIRLFGSNAESIRNIFWLTFMEIRKEKLTLCKIMVDGLDSSQRRLLLGSLPDYDGHKKVRRWQVDDLNSCCNEFISQILKSAEEIKAFQDMIINIRKPR